MPVRVLGDDGGGSIDDVARGVDWAREHGADVINLSLGSEVPLVGAGGGDSFDAAIRRAIAAGVVVVAAAGNNGVPVCEQPAAGDGLLCVGAVDKRRSRSFFSSFGSGLGLVAPGGSGATAAGVSVGEDVLSTYTGSRYEELAGTSQAAPHVAGVAALLVSRGVRGQAAVRRLLATAVDLGPPGVDAQYGAGLVNARAAVAGLGGGGSESPGGSGAPAAAPVRLFVRVRRGRGIRVRVRALHSGRVRVRVVRRGRLVARGSRVVRAGRASTVVARLNAARAPVGAAVQGAGAGSAAGRAEVARPARHGALANVNCAQGGSAGSGLRGGFGGVCGVEPNYWVQLRTPDDFGSDRAGCGHFGLNYATQVTTPPAERRPLPCSLSMRR